MICHRCVVTVAAVDGGDDGTAVVAVFLSRYKSNTSGTGVIVEINSFNFFDWYYTELKKKQKKKILKVSILLVNQKKK